MNAKTRVLLVGGIVGGLVGVLGGWLYFNTAEVEVDKEGAEHVPAPAPGDALKLVLGVLGVLRLISD